MLGLHDVIAAVPGRVRKPANARITHEDDDERAAPVIQKASWVARWPASTNINRNGGADRTGQDPDRQSSVKDAPGSAAQRSALAGRPAAPKRATLRSS